MPAWPISPFRCAGVKDGLQTANLKRQKRRQEAPSRRLFHFALGGLFELVVEGVASAPHGAHGVGLVPPNHCLAQAPDMHIDGTLVDIDVAAQTPSRSCARLNTRPGLCMRNSSR